MFCSSSCCVTLLSARTCARRPFPCCREGSTPEQTREVFADLIHWLKRDENVSSLDLVLCGPNVAAEQHKAGRHNFSDHGLSAMEQHPQPSLAGDSHGSVVTDARSTLAVTLYFNMGLYHDVSSLFPPPDVLFMFNAGLWGYDDWIPTLEHVFVAADNADASRDEHVNKSRTPSTGRLAGVVVTSYCAEEADDDMDTIECVLVSEKAGSEVGEELPAQECERDRSEVHVGSGMKWLWKPEVNPHRSLVPRRTACGVEGRVLFENHSWQAFRPSRYKLSPR